MAKVVSIEIGASLIRICEMDYKTKNPKVYKWVTIETPKGALQDDVLNVDASLVQYIAIAMRQKQIQPKKLVFSLNSTKIASREAMIPYVKENKVHDLIVANASEYFPVDLEQFELAHNILGVVEGENGTKQYRTQVFAVPKKLTEGYRDLARGLKASIVALDYSGNSMQQVLKDHFPHGVHMVVNMSVSYTMITVLRENTVMMQRTISYGLQSAVAEINSSHPQFSFLQSLNMMKERNYFQSDRPNGEEQRIRESLYNAINGIMRVVDFYNSHNEEPIEKVHFTGIGGDCLGLAEYLADSLDVETEVIEELEGWKLRKVFKNESYGSYLVCIGAAMNPIGIAVSSPDKGRKMELVPGKNDYLVLSVLVLVGGIVVAAALAFISDNAIQEANAENQRLIARRDSLKPIEQVYQEYLQQKYTTEKLNYYYDTTVLHNENLVEFIEEMEEKLPSTLNVQSFSSDESGVSLSLTVANKKDAAKLIQQLRTFDSIATVEVASISDSGAVMEKGIMDEEANVAFSVAITYKDKEAMQEAEEEEE